jgi:hypothetical protein
VGTGALVGLLLGSALAVLLGSALGCSDSGLSLGAVVRACTGSCWVCAPVGRAVLLLRRSAVGEGDRTRVCVATGGGWLGSVVGRAGVGLERSGEAVAAGPVGLSPGQPLTDCVVLENSPPTTTTSNPNKARVPAIEPRMMSRRRRPLWSTKTAVDCGSRPIMVSGSVW